MYSFHSQISIMSEEECTIIIGSNFEYTETDALPSNVQGAFVLGKNNTCGNYRGCVIIGENLHASRDWECLVSAEHTYAYSDYHISRYINFHKKYNPETKDQCVAALNRLVRLSP